MQPQLAEERISPNDYELDERVVDINRVAKVVKGSTCPPTRDASISTRYLSLANRLA